MKDLEEHETNRGDLSWQDRRWLKLTTNVRLEMCQEDKSIEAIIARSRQKDLIERVGHLGVKLHEGLHPNSFFFGRNTKVGPQAIRYLPTEDPNVSLHAVSFSFPYGNLKKWFSLVSTDDVCWLRY